MRRFLAAGGTALACKLFDGFRVKAIALASLLLILATGSFSQSAFAQSKCDCWRNSKTGEAVPSYPYHADRPVDDPNRAFVPTTGENYFRDQDCTWRNSKTGEAVPSYPYHADRPVDDPNRAFVPTTGENYFQVVPCPPQTATTTPPPGPPTEETQKVEEKKEPSWWESLIPALIPSIGIGGGRERERRQPSNPCAGK